MIDRRGFIAIGAAVALPVPLLAKASGRRCEVIELRQYTLHARRRDDLISLFDREFIGPQEALGIRVIGQFRDRDDPDRFVWLRGFDTMRARGIALPAFYHGPVWQAHRNEANATMLDSDNVMLLRPSVGTFEQPDSDRRGRGTILVGIHYLGDVDAAKFAGFFGSGMQPIIEAAGAKVIGCFHSYPGDNNFPQLPIREKEPAFVWLAQLADEPSMTALFERLRSLTGWRDTAPAECLPALMRKPELLRLAPTQGSLLA